MQAELLMWPGALIFGASEERRLFHICNDIFHAQEHLYDRILYKFIGYLAFAYYTWS